MKKYLMTAMIITAIVIIAMFGGTMKAKASTTLTSYNTEYYYYISGGTSGCGTANRYTYNKNLEGGNIESGTINNVITGQAQYFYFAFNQTLTKGKYYDITINANSNDIRSTVNQNSIYLETASSCANLMNNLTNNLSLISFTNTATSSSNSNKIKLRIYAINNVQYWGIRIVRDDIAYLTGKRNWGIKSIVMDEVSASDNTEIINNATQNTTNIINNANQNAEDIINNENSNTQEVIDNQNNNTQEIIESGKVCNIIDNDNIAWEKKYLDSNGNEVENTGWGITAYQNVYNGELTKLTQSGNSPSICFYTKDKTIIECRTNSNVSIGKITIPNNTYYVRMSVTKDTGQPQYKICKNGNQANQDSINGINDTLNENHTYNDNPNRDTTTQNNQLTSYEQEEQQLLNSLNLNIEDAEVTINGNASNFIWEIINKIRQTSGKIVLLFTSVLSLGIIKMILGR